MRESLSGYSLFLSNAIEVKVAIDKSMKTNGNIDRYLHFTRSNYVYL